MNKIEKGPAFWKAFGQAAALWAAVAVAGSLLLPGGSMTLPEEPEKMGWTVLRVCAVLPLVEELIFRGGVQRLLRPLGPGVALAGAGGAVCRCPWQRRGENLRFCHGAGVWLGRGAHRADLARHGAPLPQQLHRAGRMSGREGTGMTDYELMGAALAEAEKAAALGEVPVGAVIAKDGEIIAAAHNTRETEKNALHHAELLAIDAACKKLGGWRLWQCELFVTLEPCPMCSGAILNSRVKRVVYGAADTKAGCCGSVTDLFALPFNHHPVVERGLRAEEAQALLQAFFLRLREQRAARPKWKPPVQG